MGAHHSQPLYRSGLRAGDKSHQRTAIALQVILSPGLNGPVAALAQRCETRIRKLAQHQFNRMKRSRCPFKKLTEFFVEFFLGHISLSKNIVNVRLARVEVLLQ